MEDRLEIGISMTSSAAEPLVRQLTCAYICMLGTMEFSLQSLMDLIGMRELNCPHHKPLPCNPLIIGLWQLENQLEEQYCTERMRGRKRSIPYSKQYLNSHSRIFSNTLCASKSFNVSPTSLQCFLFAGLVKIQLNLLSSTQCNCTSQLKDAQQYVF